MFKLLKKYFIPQEENNYKPHLLQEGSMVIVTALVIMIFIGAVGAKEIVRRTDLTALVLPKVLVDYANDDRLSQNFRKLAISTTLEKAAQLKANDMAKKGYFAHKSPDGKTPWYWFDEAGYDFSYAGENLAVNFSDSVDVNSAWMNSPGHRQNIMNNNFTEIGIATAEGYYNGRPTTFVVQLFGRPSIEAATLIKSLSTTTAKSSNTKNTTKVISTIASSSVLGASGENDLYIAVEKASSVVKPNIDGSYSNIIEKIIVSPKKSLSVIYLAIALIIIIGLFLTIFIEIKKQHPKYIILPIIILILIFGLLYLYQSVIFTPLLIA